jgi:hypothetical protein
LSNPRYLGLDTTSNLKYLSLSIILGARALGLTIMFGVRLRHRGVAWLPQPEAGLPTLPDLGEGLAWSSDPSLLV